MEGLNIGDCMLKNIANKPEIEMMICKRGARIQGITSFLTTSVFKNVWLLISKGGASSL